MLARDVPVSEVARQMGVTRWTILTWAKTDEARQHIAAVQASVKEATKHLAIADKVRRILDAQAMVDGIDTLIAARKEAGEQPGERMPGEATGHVAVKDIEIRGVRTREAAFDASLHDQRRKWMEYAAKELDDLEARVNVRHSGRIDHVIQRRDLSALTDDELDQLTELAMKIEAGTVES